WLWISQLIEIVGRPPCGLSAQDCEFIAVTFAQPHDARGPRLALKGDDDRSISRVSASSRMVAIAFGAQVENRCGLCSPLDSTLRMTCAAALVWPLLRMPRSSSLSPTKLSASSISRVGRTTSIYRKSADAEILDASSERGVR